MRAFTCIVGFILLLTTGGVAAAADVTISEPFPEGTALNPVSSEDTLVFGDVRASIVSNEVGEDGNRVVDLEIENNLPMSLWIEPGYLHSFAEGRYLGNAQSESSAESFNVVSMETENGNSEVAYEWYMTLNAGGTGVITLEIAGDAEVLCYQPYASNVSLLLDEADNRIHGCWLLQ